MQTRDRTINIVLFVRYIFSTIYLKTHQMQVLVRVGSSDILTFLRADQMDVNLRENVSNDILESVSVIRHTITFRLASRVEVVPGA